METTLLPNNSKDKLVIAEKLWALISELYRSDLNTLMSNVIEEHVTNNPNASHFFYKGHTYLANKWVKPINSVPLTPSAVEDMQKYMDIDNRLKEHQSLFVSIIGSMLLGAKTYQDLRNILPDEFVNFFSANINFNLPRTVEIEDIPFCTSHVLAQHQKIIIPMVNYYIGMELVR